MPLFKWLFIFNKTSITLHSYHVLCVWLDHLRSTLEISKFQVYNTGLLMTVTMLYIRPLEVFHLITKSLYHLTIIYPFPPNPQCLAIIILLSASMSLTLFQILHIRSHSICLSVSCLFHLISYFPNSSMLQQTAGFLFYVRIKFHYNTCHVFFSNYLVGHKLVQPL